MRLTSIFFLILTTVAHCQVRMPADATVQVGRLASVRIEVDADQVDYVVVGADVDAFREYDPQATTIRLRVIGYKPGVATVVVVGQKGGKLLPIGLTKITFEGNQPPLPPAPPGPNPPIPPSPPDNPDVDATLLGQLTAAKGNWQAWQFLAAVISAQRQKVADRSVTTAGELQASMRDAIVAAFPKNDVPQAIRDVINNYLKSNLPSAPDAALDRAKHAQALFTLGKTLEAVK